MRPIFNSIRVTKPGKNAFDLSHERKLSLKMGDLVPIFLEEVVPGDSFRVNSEIFARLAPLVSPMMHRVNLYVHFFFVPNRLVWSNFQKFITGGEDGLESPVLPRLQISESSKSFFLKGSLADYMGIPPVDAGDTVLGTREISALPFRAYQLIYNEYYRDQNLQSAVEFPIDDTIGASLGKLAVMRQRCWEKDYFTSALPFAQRGEDVVIPSDIDYSTYSKVYDATQTDPTLLPGASILHSISNLPDIHGSVGSVTGTSGTPVRIENVDGVSITVNDLRRATRLQMWLEKNARAGARYIEQIFSHFGVKSSDARLQRPEFLGGTKQPIVVSEVLSTNSADNVDPLGTMGGHAVSVNRDFAFKRFFEEHGMIIGIMSVMPKTAYSQGIPKFFRKFDKFDFFWPEFAQLGEQEVKNWEVFIDHARDPEAVGEEEDRTFGYQSRYCEYKFKESSVHGDFRDVLEYWHMSRKFADPPVLNSEFVTSNPTDRVFAVQDGSDNIYVQIFHDVKAIRPMPIFGTPTL